MGEVGRAHRGYLAIEPSVITVKGRFCSSSTFASQVGVFKDAVIKLSGDTNRTLALVMQYLVTGREWHKGIEDPQNCSAVGVPVYHSTVNAAKAIEHVLRYHEKRRMAGQ